MEGIRLFEIFDDLRPNDVITLVEAYTGEEAVRKFKGYHPEILKMRPSSTFGARDASERELKRRFPSYSSDDNNGYY